MYRLLNEEGFKVKSYTYAAVSPLSIKLIGLIVGTLLNTTVFRSGQCTKVKSLIAPIPDGIVSVVKFAHFPNAPVVIPETVLGMT